MLNADLMQFKDEMLKTLREMEKKLMLKVNKTNSDISTDIKNIYKDIQLLKDNNISIIDSMAEHKVYIDKINDFEKTLKKMSTTLSGHENKITDSILEISYIRNRCEKSITETFSVPGIIGKNCKYSNFNEYIISNMKDISNLKTEKDYNKKESKELRQKLEHGIKNLSALVDTFIKTSKIYTDNTKKNIIELMDSKIGEIDDKSMEFMTKLFKIESDTEKKIKTFEDLMEDFNKKKNVEFQKMEDELLLINDSLEKMNKKIDTNNEEINFLKNNEKKYKIDISELKNTLKKLLNNNHINPINYNYSYRKTNNSINFQKDNNLSLYSSSRNLFSLNKGIDKNINKFSVNSIKKNKTLYSPKEKKTQKSKISLLLGDSNLNTIKRNYFSNKNLINQINKGTFNNFEIEKRNKNLELNSLTMHEESSQDSEEIGQTEENEDIKKNNLNKNKEPINSTTNYKNFSKETNNNSKRENILDLKNTFNNSKKYFSFDKNNILEEKNDNSVINTKIKSKINLHKTFRENAYSLDNNLLLQNNINSSNIKEIKPKKEDIIINNKEISNLKPTLLSQIINVESSINPINNNPIKKYNHYPLIEKSIHNPQFKTNIHNPFSIINNKKMIISPKNINNNHINNNLLLNNEDKSRNRINITTDKHTGIDKETGVGYNFVKLSFNGNTMTPYNTNGLLTLACKKYLNKNLIYVDESTPYEDIYLMNKMYMNYTNQNFKNNNSYTKKNYSYDNYDIITQKSNNKNQEKRNNKNEKNFSKTINPSEAYIIGKVKFNLLQKKK